MYLFKGFNFPIIGLSTCNTPDSIQALHALKYSKTIETIETKWDGERSHCGHALKCLPFPLKGTMSHIFWDGGTKRQNYKLYYQMKHTTTFENSKFDLTMRIVNHSLSIHNTLKDVELSLYCYTIIAALYDWPFPLRNKLLRIKVSIKRLNVNV